MTSYRLVRDRAPVTVPQLDPDQQRVVDHEGGPLLVLAGPGTGKTTTLVEAIVDRIEHRGVDPSQILALTFSRKAAESLRDRVTARVGRTLANDLSRTFHSFAYGLVRAHSPAGLYAAPLRLLSAPEQDVVLQELLTHADESVVWPDELRLAIGTRGFSGEVLDVLARAREKGLEGHDLTALGERHDRPEFVAAGRFLEQYLAVLDNLGALDYPDLIRRAVLDAEEHRAELRERFTHVFVDEYQDTDPSQVRLLRALAGDGRNLTVVGDPHQSIYGFRGADVGGILRFPTSFPQLDGSPAPVVALRTTRRFGPRLLTATQRVAGRLALSGTIPPDAQEAFARPRTESASYDDGLAQVVTFDTDRAEAEHLADLLRRAHLEEGLAWSEMAVLVRSAQATLPALRRALSSAGVPIEVAADDTPLVREPAVVTLLGCLAVVLHGLVDDPTDPHYVHPSAVSDLLVSPLVDLDATELRALARQLRARDLASPGEPRPSAELVREAALHPEMLDGVAGDAVERVRGFAALIERARAELAEGATAEDVLWTIWSGTPWPARLHARSQSGGRGARLAHRDLDAAVALFEAAGRSEQQHGHRSVREFTETLRAQQIPADTLAERGVRGDAVRLLTAHRSKGLEWRLVVVAHAQEGAWPDLRRRSTLLRPDRIGAHDLEPPTTSRAILTEERRLFYVACTRARERLVVTAVASSDPDGEQPSRFLGELGLHVDHRQGRPRRPLSVTGLVADLRRTLADPTTDSALREVAARRLARLATEEHDGRPLVPSADPATWWGIGALTRAEVPIRPADAPLVISASTLAGLIECPAKWFLEREAGGSSSTSQSQGFGNIAHALADRVARDELPAGPGEVGVLMAEVDRVWGRLTFRTPWSGEREREEMEGALSRFLDWHHRDRSRTWLASEAEFRTTVTLPDQQQVTLFGYADRLELDADGRVVVVDLKTGKYPPTDKDLAENPQLGLYQYAVDHGAFAEPVPSEATSGGAELWQLRKSAYGKLKVQPQAPQVPDDDGHTLIERQLMDAATALREERLEVRPGQICERCAFQRLCPTQQSGTVLS